MNKRPLIALVVGLALAISLALWLLSTAPTVTQDQVRQDDGDSEPIVVSTQGQSPASTDRGGRAEALPKVGNSLPDETRDEDASEPAVTATAAPPSSNSASEARVASERARGESATPVLGEYVFAVIEDVQQQQLDGRWEESLVDLNALYEDFDQLNSFEQTTLLNFYTNTLLRFEMWPEAIGAFSRMLTIPDLRPDLGARALMALGQLHARVGEYAASISYLTSWQDMTTGMENMERSNATVTSLLAQSRTALQQSTLEGQ